MSVPFHVNLKVKNNLKQKFLFLCKDNPFSFLNYVKSPLKHPVIVNIGKKIYLVKHNIKVQKETLFWFLRGGRDK